MKVINRSSSANVKHPNRYFSINIIKHSLVILLMAELSCFTPVFAQEKLEDVIVLHPKTQDTLLVASQVVKEVKENGVIILKRPKNTYQLSFSFPYHGWKADFSMAEWNPTNDILLLSNPDNLSGFCLAEQPVRRGLEISSVKARLAIIPKSLTLEGIAGIRVANGFVVPSSPKSMTLSGKNIPTLENATLLLNAFSRYHKITECRIVLESRFSYEIEGGTFHYKRMSKEKGKENEEFTFKNFEHSSKVINPKENVGIVTEILVDVSERDKFVLEDGRLFKGKMKFVDSSPVPTFNGKVKDTDGKWIRYRSK